MKKNNLNTLFLVFLIFFISCENAPIKINIGEEFKHGKSPITILKLEESKILRSEKKQIIKMAPSGKKYVYLDVHNPNDAMIFLNVYVNNESLEKETSLYDFSHKIGTGFNDAYFLLNEDAVIEKVEISTPGDDKFEVVSPKISKGETAEISKEIKRVINSYSTKKAIGLLQGFAPFIPNGKSVYEIATQGGSPIASNIMSNEAHLSYFTKDNKKYVLRIKNIFGSIATVTSYWDDGKVTKIEVVE